MTISGNCGTIIVSTTIATRLCAQVHTAGLLNIIGAPHLANDSTYATTYTRSRVSGGLAPSLVLGDSSERVRAVLGAIDAAGGVPPRVAPDGYWSSGWPRLDVQPKLGDAPETAGLQLPLFFANVSALRSRVLSAPRSMWDRAEQTRSNVAMSGRSANMERFKPGVEGQVLMFSDNEGSVVYEVRKFEI
jgi:hypothetical protein